MPFAHLGVSADADERDVRRAYARRLKVTRPDDDPVAFQRLHEAYQACLVAIARRGEEDDGIDDGIDADNPEVEVDVEPAVAPYIPLPGERFDSAPAHAPAPATTSEPAADAADHGATTIEFDFAMFMGELLPRLRRDSPKLLKQWLYAHPDLYSFRLKQALTVDVLRIVAEQEPPVPLPALDALAAFFGLDDAGPGGWWLRERIEQARADTEMRARFRRLPLPRVDRHQSETWFDRQIDAELVQPAARWRTALLLLMPGLLGRVRARIAELEHLGGRHAVEAMNPERHALYVALTDRHAPDRRRFALSAARSLFYGGGALLTVHALGFAAADVAPALALLAAGFLLSHLAGAAWLRGVATLQARVGTWERELSTLALHVIGATIACSPLEQIPALDVTAYCLLLFAAVRVLTLPRLLAGVIMLFPLFFLEFVIRDRFELGNAGAFVPMLCATAWVPLALDRFLAWRSGLDPRQHAENPRPLGFLLGGSVLTAALASLAWSLLAIRG